MPKKIYVNSTELEEWWYGWILTGDIQSWEQMIVMIYRICEGVAIKFHPKSPEEHQEHVHDALTQTMEKIKLGKLKYIHGKAPVFNLLTTTIFRILYSKMNRAKKQKDHLKRYTYDSVQKNIPDMLGSLEYPYQKKDNLQYHNSDTCKVC